MPSRGPASLSRVCVAVGRTVWFSFYLGCHRSAVSLSAINVSPLTQTIAPVWGSVPALQRAGPVLITLLFFPLVPSSYWVLYGCIYSFLVVRSSCLLSAGVPHAHLCLKVCSWCIHAERCTPHPPTPLPPCSLTLVLSAKNRCRFSALTKTSLGQGPGLSFPHPTQNSLTHII